MAQTYKIPLMLRAQPEGGYTVTSPALPELITEAIPPRRLSRMCQMPWQLWSNYMRILASPCPPSSWEVLSASRLSTRSASRD
jgi:hypothetical protein